MAQKILFLCPHNAAKSVIAATHFNRLAQTLHLPFVADSAGTEPDEAAAPVVVAMLAGEGIDVSQHSPRRVTAADLQNAAHIVSMGCTVEALDIAPERLELWLDVPQVSQEPERARDSIRTHVEQLITELRAKS